MNLDKAPKTLKEVNKEISKAYPNVLLTKGNGYFYLISNDDKTALMLTGLNSTSIYCNALHNLSIKRWICEVDNILKDVEVFSNHSSSF